MCIRDRSNYQSFRLFAVAGKTDYQNESDAKIDKIIKENNILYERIDRGLRFGNLEAEMSKTCLLYTSIAVCVTFYDF